MCTCPRFPATASSKPYLDCFPLFPTYCPFSSLSYFPASQTHFAGKKVKSPISLSPLPTLPIPFVMKPISKSSSPMRKNESFYRYLKPGALAQLRDSKISARSHRENCPDHSTFLPVSLSRTQIQISIIDHQVPCFLSKLCNPQCLRRKKLVANKSVMVLNLGPSGSVLESNNSDSFINVLNNDVLDAH